MVITILLISYVISVTIGILLTWAVKASHWCENGVGVEDNVDRVMLSIGSVMPIINLIVVSNLAAQMYDVGPRKDLRYYLPRF